MSDSVLTCANVGVTYADTPVFSDLNFTCRSAEILAVLGPSGCGKTTLLRVIAGLHHTFTGTVSAPVNPAVVFQDSRLIPWRNILDNASALNPKRHKAAAAILTQVGLQHYAHSLPHELSGGMQRRVALARAFVHTNGLLLMDEPFTGVDPALRRELHRTVLDLWSSQQPTIILVTHDIDDVVSLADRALIFPTSTNPDFREVIIDCPRNERQARQDWISGIRKSLDLANLEDSSCPS